MLRLDLRRTLQVRRRARQRDASQPRPTDGGTLRSGAKGVGTHAQLLTSWAEAVEHKHVANTRPLACRRPLTPNPLCGRMGHTGMVRRRSFVPLKVTAQP